MEDRKEWKTGEKSDIEIRNLSVSFQDGGETVHAMEGVNAYFPAGSVTGLIGESGSGKSLLGMSILGLLSGQAKVEGTCMYKGMVPAAGKGDAGDPRKRDLPDSTESHGVVKPDPENRKTAHGVHERPWK